MFRGNLETLYAPSNVATSSCSAIAQSGGRDAGKGSGISAVR
ncbi:hypothetical protein [Lusitaniella coriacea]|nr:hypothetical protein [Lusitaniella coriacea]